jgi:hypothetical protein
LHSSQAPFPYGANFHTASLEASASVLATTRTSSHPTPGLP